MSLEFKELCTIAYNSARDGNLPQMMFYINLKSKEERKEIVNTMTCKSTPLLIASRNGYLNVVRYLIHRCHADVELVGQVTFDSDIIEGASPIWCAASAGHFDIVQELFNCKASINCVTANNSTPLRGACFSGEYDIVKFLVNNGADIEIANNHSHTCLMIAAFKGHLDICQFLIEHGADINRKSKRGNTALHDSAENGNLQIFLLLLFYGARMEVDGYGMTPLMTAAISGNSSIVEYLLNNMPLETIERINALEALGAAYVDKHNDTASAFNYWKQAMMLHRGYSKFSISQSELYRPIATFINAAEIEDINELEIISNDLTAMRIQALLKKERLLGSDFIDTIFSLRYLCTCYAENGDFEESIKLWLFSFDILQFAYAPLHSMTLNALQSFVEFFAFVLSNAQNRTVLPHIYCDILNVLCRAVQEIKNAMCFISKDAQENNKNFYFVLKSIVFLIDFLVNLTSVSEEDELKFKKTVYSLICMNPKCESGWTFLHVVLSSDPDKHNRYSLSSFPLLPSLNTIELLLKLGVSVNAMDNENNTPLHIALRNSSFSVDLVKLLLNYGAHIDISNNDKETPLDLLHALNHFDICPLQYQTLKCLSARAVIKAQIPYHNIVPTEVQQFLDFH